MKRSGIYAIESPSRGRYVGSAVDLTARKRRHFHELRHGRHSNRGLQRAAIKYGIEALSFKVLLICRPEDLIFFEQRVIDTFRPRYNSRIVAESQLGMRHSNRTKARISKSKRGHPVHSDAHKKALATRMIGNRFGSRQQGDLEKERRRSSLKGRRHKDGFLSNLTDGKIRDIRRAYDDGEGIVALAMRYRTHHRNIRQIVDGA